MESYIADLVLFLMELLGPKRSEIFKRTHLGIKPEKPLAAQTLYNTPGGKNKEADDLMGASRNDRYATTMYGSAAAHKRGKTQLPENNLMPGSAISEEYQTLQLPALDSRSLDGGAGTGPVSEKKSSHRKSKNQNSGSKSVEPRGVMTTIPLESLGNESTAQNLATAANPVTVRDSLDSTAVFDTKKWKKMLNGNISMI